MAKQKFKINNWAAYNKALVNRGSLTSLSVRIVVTPTENKFEGDGMTNETYFPGTKSQHTGKTAATLQYDRGCCCTDGRNIRSYPL
ncbi:hypothetical protein EO763_08825 [Pectobacterium odoriferum]|nr:hypothetical protein EO763_08825 [Pectobacterium odoriferum]